MLSPADSTDHASTNLTGISSPVSAATNEISIHSVLLHAVFITLRKLELSQSKYLKFAVKGISRAAADLAAHTAFNLHSTYAADSAL